MLNEATGVQSWQDVGYKGPTNFDDSGIWGKTFFTWVSPIMERGKATGLSVEDAGPLLSARDRVDNLVSTFNAPYTRELSRTSSQAKKQRNAFLYAIVRSHLGYMLLQCFWTVLESAFRIGSPVALRQLVKWLSEYEDGEKDTDDAVGWMWAVLLCLFGVGLALGHHQLFWCGMRLGFQMKQQVLLRATGMIVNGHRRVVRQMAPRRVAPETHHHVWWYRLSRQSRTRSCSSTAQHSVTSPAARS